MNAASTPYDPRAGRPGGGRQDTPGATTVTGAIANTTGNPPGRGTPCRQRRNSAVNDRQMSRGDSRAMPYRAATGFQTCTKACLAASARWLALNAAL
jgi:hypothetical protein